MEHGLDERHVPLFEARPLVPPVLPQGHHVLADVRLFGEFRPADLARRGRAHEGVASRQDAGG